MRLREAAVPSVSAMLLGNATALPRTGRAGHAHGVVPHPLLRESLGRDVPIGNRLRTSPYELRISKSLLRRIFPRARAELASAYVEPMNLYMSRYEIDSVCRISAFLGQVTVETGGLTKSGEDLFYKTVDNLKRAYGRRDWIGRNYEDYLRSPEKVANFAYAGINGNGDEESGDGWRFRGRGLLQLTGRANYTRFSKDVSIDVVTDPDMVSNTPSIAVLSACWYWSVASLNRAADNQNFLAITTFINGRRALHHPERVKAMWHVRDCLLHELGHPSW